MMADEASDEAEHHPYPTWKYGDSEISPKKVMVKII